MASSGRISLMLAPAMGREVPSSEFPLFACLCTSGQGLCLAHL